jgi:hypothetical protein
MNSIDGKMISPYCMKYDLYSVFDRPSHADSGIVGWPLQHHIVSLHDCPITNRRVCVHHSGCEHHNDIRLVSLFDGRRRRTAHSVAGREAAARPAKLDA